MVFQSWEKKPTGVTLLRAVAQDSFFLECMERQRLRKCRKESCLVYRRKAMVLAAKREYEGFRMSVD